MRVVLAGYFEAALVTNIDAAIRPDRNRTTHPYYMCLNREVSKAHFDRVGTFLALSDEVLIPQIDWAMPPQGDGPPELRSDRLGVAFDGRGDIGGREWDDDTTALANILLDNQAFSSESLVHLGKIRGTSLDDIVSKRLLDQDSLERKIGHHALCRLLLQIRTAHASAAFLTVPETELSLIQEIGRFIQQTGLPLPYALPDLTGRVIAGEAFASGLLNFSPPDALVLGAIKADPTIKKYAGKVRSVMGDLDSEDAQRAMLLAMKDAYEKFEAGQRVEKIFEVASWLVKPLHYVPGVGEGLTAAEDVKDLVVKWLDREVSAKEFFLLGARMTDVAIKDYLARKANLMGQD